MLYSRVRCSGMRHIGVFTVYSCLLSQVSSFEAGAQAVMYSEDAPNRQAIEALLDTAASVDVEFDEVPRLKQLLAQAQWLEKVTIAMHG